MKSATFLLLIQLLWGFITPAFADKGPQSTDTIEIFSTPGLSGLTGNLVNEYSRQFPEVKIRISILPDKAEGTIPDTGLNFVSGGYYQGSEDKQFWRVIIGRDVIVPVISAENPFLTEILHKGISPENLKQVFESKVSRHWGMLLKNGVEKPIHFYILNDEMEISAIQKFLNSTPLMAEITKFNSADEVIAAIQKDPYGLGFTKMASIPGYKDQLISENIRLMPIDINNNGLVDYNENIYEDLNMFSRGIWIGKYSKSLYSNIYTVSEKQPEKVAEIAFMRWILGDGQVLLADNGYSDLIKSERQSAIDRLYIPVNIPEEKTALSPFIILALFFVSLAIFFFLAENAIRFVRKGKMPVIHSNVLPGRLTENSLLVPKGLFFDKTHTWVFMEQNGLLKIGVDDFLQHITGTITRIKLKNPGEKIRKGEYIMSIIRNGKQLNLYSPVSGIIKEHNNNLDTDSSVINSSPYNLGWVYRLEPTNWLREMQLLLMSDQYAEWIKSEFSRMKDFLALTLSSDREQYSKVILQDGGELTDSTLADLGPEIWDDFQTKFIDASK